MVPLARLGRVISFISSVSEACSKGLLHLAMSGVFKAKS